jgi:diguanylate cyclase (GGDEF)-like protein/PAS domain S-box-containing protein
MSKSVPPAPSTFSEARFLRLIATIPQQVWTAGPDGSLDFVNQQVIDYFGMSYESMLGTGWVDIVHPDDVHEAILRWTKSLATGADYETDFRLRRADGVYRWHIARASALVDADGEVIQWVGTSTDITERKEAEAARALSETHLAAAQARALIGSWELDLVTRTGSASAEWFQIMGRDPALGMPNVDDFIAAIHPDDLASVREQHAKAIHEKNGSQYDFRVLRPDGSIRWVEARVVSVFNHANIPLRMSGTTQDISARKQIEVELQESEARLAAAQARAKIGSWRRDLATNEAEWSAEMYRIFRRDPALKPPSFRDFVHLLHPEDRKSFTQYYRRYIRDGSDYQIDFRVLQPNGECLWIEARSETVCDSNGRAILLTGTAQDISERKHAELALNASESRFRAFMEKTPVLAFIKDEPGHFVYINPTFERVFQVSQADVIGKTVFDCWPPEVAQRLHDHDVSIFASNKQTESFENVPTPDGMRHWLTVKFVFNNALGQRFLGCTAIDLTDHHRAEQALRTSTQLLEDTQALAKLGGWAFDIPAQKLFWTDQIYRMLETSPQAITPTVSNSLNHFEPASSIVLKQALDNAMQHGKGYDLELQMRTLKGRLIDVRATCSVVFENDLPVKLYGILQDISEQKAAQLALETANVELEYANQILEHIANYDALTHLPNRVLLADRMQQAMLQSQRSGQSLAVIFLDLDGFKTVNDQYGHGIGDRLLITLSQRMKAALREGDTLARIGGDEFVVVLTNLKQTSDCEPLLMRLLEAAAEPVQLDDHRLEVSASIGVTLYPQDGVDAEQLLRHADQAMYLAKQAGKNCYHLFDVAHDVAVKHKRENLEHIRSALRNREFVLYYQPKVNMRTGAIIGAEALIRWQHPERGLLAPATFLPVIENHILSVELGEWVIATALEQMADWQMEGLEIPVSVNVGALQLQQSDFANRLEELLIMQPHANPSNLELEILETSAMEDITQVSTAIHACQLLGVSFALDDFGTGYSSLTYLKRLPAELLKIDQSFVRDMLDDSDDLAIIEGIIGLATAFHRNVIAEGVETIEHGEKLLSIGCELAQGYGIARPMPASAIPAWAKTWRPDSKWSTGL